MCKSHLLTALRLVSRTGSNGNEGLGMFSLCLDWNYVGSGGGSLGALFTPLTTQVSQYIGECLLDLERQRTASLTPFSTGVALCIIIFCGMYATNAWNSGNFPFLSQQLFFENGEKKLLLPPTACSGHG